MSGSPGTIAFLIHETQKIVAFAKKVGGKSDFNIMAMAEPAWQSMIDSAGNNGQLAILQQITVRDIAMAILALLAYGAEPEENILPKVNHPEAVSEILDQLYQDIQDAADELEQQGFSQAAAGIGGEGEGDSNEIPGEITIE